MTLIESDEALHVPPDSIPPNWQENLFFIAWDPDHQHGFMSHVKRVPSLGWQEALTVICVGGRVVSTTVREPFDNGSIAPGHEMRAVDPFERWIIRTAIRGPEGYGPFGFIATRPGATSQASCDLQLMSKLPAVDFHNLYKTVISTMRETPDSPQMGAEPDSQHHYEQGGTWEGSLEIDGDRVRACGLFVRDHSWGVRHERSSAEGGAFQAFWTASCLDEGAIYCNAIGWPHPGGTLGVGVYADSTGVKVTTEIEGWFWPLGGLWSYDKTRITYGAGVDKVLEAETDVHWPMYLPYSGFRRYDNNALSRVRVGESVGFGVMEWAAVMSSSQADLIDAGLPVAAPGLFDGQELEPEVG